MSASKPKQPVYGNPQINTRFDRETHEAIRQRAEAEGLSNAQDWVRKVVLAALGTDTATVNRSEFDSLRDEVEALKKL